MEARRSRTAPRGEQDQRMASGDATRKRILKSAERLFAKSGIDAVSIRDITDAAGVNTAAIHYHFGSKSGLVEALLARWAGELVERRGRMLDRIEAQPKVHLRDVVDVLVWPMIELGGARRGGGGYVGFLAAVMNHPEYIPLMNELYEPDISRTLALLEQVTPHLSNDVRMLRWAIAKDTVNRTVSVATSPVHLWLKHYAPHAGDSLGERLVDFLTGAFEAEATA
ncbi:MAG TPA: TetR family transcriptional regulator [Frankiaceae bacterium]|jgi:AcrR family transcriptional regulator|nr:TetR family transcriptional regulator [Frankiaceae bacterium]